MALRFDLDLDRMAVPAISAPAMIAIEEIDEDPTQPRDEFDPETLQELAASIEQVGVLQPVSVRPHPASPGRWILNFGARRYRASKLAGKKEIPAFVDDSTDLYKQVIENLHRDNLRPFAMARIVGQLLSTGLSQNEVARRLGKSQPYISFLSGLFNPPEWLLSVYRERKCRGIKELCELRRLHGDKPLEVEKWVAARSYVTRDDLAELRELCEAQRNMSLDQSAATVASPADAMPLRTSDEVAPKGRQSRADVKAKQQHQVQPPSKGRAAPGRLVITAEANGREVQLVLDVLPDAEGTVYVIGVDDGTRRAARLEDLSNFAVNRHDDVIASRVQAGVHGARQ